MNVSPAGQTLCRHCRSDATAPFLDLGHAPLSNAYLTQAGLREPETTYPLRLFVCERCRLVQTEDHAAATDVFGADYAYFSSTSSGWVAHAKAHVETMAARLDLGANSFVVEVASNDGYLLQHVRDRGIPCLGIEPTAATAAAARMKGIEVEEVFFGETLGHSLAASGCAADLVIANNVLAHVPDIDDFMRGIAALLKPEGVVTLEFPHLMRLVEHRQFDTVYHEHFSYLSLMVVRQILDAAGLRAFDVEELPTHGGSLRVHGCRSGTEHPTTPAVAALVGEERARGMDGPDFYNGFQGAAEAVKDAALRFLLEQKRAGARVAAYGAAAKGNTLLNFAGVRPDLLPFVCDAASAKQGLYMPGSHIPILAPDALRASCPDVVVILPWNLETEIRAQFADLAQAGTRFATFVPELRVG